MSAVVRTAEKVSGFSRISSFTIGTGIVKLATVDLNVNVIGKPVSI